MLYDEILLHLKGEAADHGLSREEMERLAAEMAEPARADEAPKVEDEVEYYFFRGPEEGRRMVSDMRENGWSWEILCAACPRFVYKYTPGAKGRR